MLRQSSNTPTSEHKSNTPAQQARISSRGIEATPSLLSWQGRKDDINSPYIDDCYSDEDSYASPRQPASGNGGGFSIGFTASRTASDLFHSAATPARGPYDMWMDSFRDTSDTAQAPLASSDTSSLQATPAQSAGTPVPQPMAASGATPSTAATAAIEAQRQERLAAAAKERDDAIAAALARYDAATLEIQNEYFRDYILSYADRKQQQVPATALEATAAGREDDPQEPRECQLCYDRLETHVLLPCRHRLCGSCGEKLSSGVTAKCPWDRQLVEQVQEVDE
ncbi:hypothetical protein RI367_004848 [Sorochytrium milnesiophthora]